MRWLLALLFIGSALAAESPREIDPNTKIQGGADVRGSGASAGAGAGAQTENRIGDEKKPDVEKDKPISERKPQEREREDASQGDTIKAPQQ